jgi:hypothetical protein
MGYRKYLLLIVPFAYLFLGSYFHQIIGNYFLRTSDPECIYFMSGLCVANGKFILGHFDNPGTPLQYLAALVFRGIYIFRSHHIPFNNDVLTNPDLYLHTLNLVMTSIVAVFLYFGGKIAFRVSNNLTYSALLQLTPLFTSLIYLNIARIVPETLIPIPAVLMSIMLLHLLYNQDDKNEKKQSIIFGLISAFGLSIKLTFLPLWIIPFMVLKKWKNKLIYSATAVLSFFVFAIPVTLQLNKFWGWVKGLFLHSGKYGQGDSNFIDWNAFGTNFNSLWNENHFFFYVVIGLAVALAASFILFLKNKRENLSLRISFALLVAAFLQIVLVCKQFESRYFVPALMLIPVSVIIIIELAQQFSPFISKYKLGQIAAVFVVIGYFNSQKPIVHSLSVVLQERNFQKMKAMHYMQNIETDALKFIVTSDYGAPIPEYSLTHSYRWAGRYQELFKPALAEIYPNSYVYFPWENSMNFWGKEPDYSEPGRPAYIYFLTDDMKDKFFQDAAKYFPEKYELTRTFFNETTKESIYRLVKVSSE